MSRWTRVVAAWLCAGALVAGFAAGAAGCARAKPAVGADPVVGPPAAMETGATAPTDAGVRDGAEPDGASAPQPPTAEDAAAEALEGVREQTAEAASADDASRVIALAEGLRVDLRARRVEIDGFVPIDVQNPRVPRVFLEVLLCRRDSREHETLVVTDVRPSLVHAGLLLLGQEAGDPGAWRFEGNRAVLTPPTGSSLRVLVRVDRDGAIVEEPLASWARSVDGARVLDEAGAAFVFAGSRFVRRRVDGAEREVYVADGAGTIVGLSTFGDEVIAWTGEHHPDTSVMAPAWVADPARVPPVGTPVTVVLVPERNP